LGRTIDNVNRFQKKDDASRKQESHKDLEKPDCPILSEHDTDYDVILSYGSGNRRVPGWIRRGSLIFSE
jgi:hypothetical protein